jgi:hypothetical protein
LKPETITKVLPPPPPALPKIILNGITTITGHRLALLKVQFPAKPGEPAREQSLIMNEGQRDGDIELLQIDEKAGRVKVSNSGTITILTFDNEGAKDTAAPVKVRLPKSTAQSPPTSVLVTR